MANFYNGRRIVLTGASSGIGLALARHLSVHGAIVLATGARAKADLPAEFPDIAYVSVDMAGPNCADKLAGAVADLGWPGIDLLILNAGTGRHAPVETETAQTIDNVVAVNLTAPVRIAHRFAEQLIESTGQVVLIGSVVHKGADDFPVYAATKAALDGF
ncbi:MAG: SDR family NAD(P)-dependent oxidoreductase, partial [Alphaproteobacteria bacterium]